MNLEIKRKINKLFNLEARKAYLFILPLILVVFIFILIPVIGTFINAFFQDVSYLPKKFIGLKNYINLFLDKSFWQVLFFTLSFTIVSVSLELLFGMIFALILNEAFIGRNIFRAIILIPWAIPTIISAKTWKLMYEYTYGLINFLLVTLGFVDEKVNWLGSSFSAFWAIVAADVWKATPFVVIILLAGMQGILPDIYRQAKIDGAGMFKRFFKITFPLLKPIIIITLIFRTIDALRLFDLIYVLTGGGPGGSTKSLSFLGFEYFSNDIYGKGSAVSIVTFLISFLISLLYIKVGKFHENISLE